MTKKRLERPAETTATGVKLCWKETLVAALEGSWPHDQHLEHMLDHRGLAR